jgi:hypothetical protein
MAGTTSGVDFNKVGSDINMKIYQGKTLRFSIIYSSKVAPIGPINITGWTASLQARGMATWEEKIIDLSTANGKVTIDGLLGKINFYLSATDSSLLTSGSGIYDLELTDTLNNTIQLMSGSISIIPQVSR